MNRSSKGFTLIELVFVMLLLALLMSVALPSVTNVLGINLRSAATNFTGYLRACREESIMKQKQLRLRLDFETGKYWVESLDPPPTIPMLDESTKIDDALKSFEEDSEKEELSDQEKKEQQDSYYKRVDSRLLKASSLPRGIRFKGVYLSTEAKVIESGSPAIFFAPNGYASKAIVYLVNDAGTVTTVILPSLAGRSRVEKGEVRPEDA